MNFEIRAPQARTYEDRKAEWLSAVKTKPNFYLNAPEDLKNDLDIAWMAVQKQPNLITHLGSGLAVQCNGDDPVKKLEILATHKQLEATMAHKQEQQPRKGMKL